jgi:hypothetical protein
MKKLRMLALALVAVAIAFSLIACNSTPAPCSNCGDVVFNLAGGDAVADEAAWRKAIDDTSAEFNKADANVTFVEKSTEAINIPGNTSFTVSETKTVIVGNKIQVGNRFYESINSGWFEYEMIEFGENAGKYSKSYQRYLPDDMNTRPNALGSATFLREFFGAFDFVGGKYVLNADKMTEIFTEMFWEDIKEEIGDLEALTPEQLKEIEDLLKGLLAEISGDIGTVEIAFKAGKISGMFISSSSDISKTDIQMLVEITYGGATITLPTVTVNNTCCDGKCVDCDCEYCNEYSCSPYCPCWVCCDDHCDECGCYCECDED